MQKEPWVRSSEYRSQAKVPIVNIIQSISEIECDVSFGIISENTSNIVMSLLHNRQPNIFYKLVKFLKIFLHLYNFDQPFTGGLGSYRLYIMVAFILQYSPLPDLTMISNHFKLLNDVSSQPDRHIYEYIGKHSNPQLESRVDKNIHTNIDVSIIEEDYLTAYYLLTFFKYFGNKMKFNVDTTLYCKTKIYKNSKRKSDEFQSDYDTFVNLDDKEMEVSINFKPCFKLVQVQQLFLKCYLLLNAKLSKHVKGYSRSDATSETSFLGFLIPSKLVQQYRQWSRDVCHFYVTSNDVIDRLDNVTRKKESLNSNGFEQQSGQRNYKDEVSVLHICA